MEKSVTGAAGMKDPAGMTEAVDMEKPAGGLSAADLKEVFCLEGIDAAQLSPLTLAYVGDAVYELIVRTVIVGGGDLRPKELQRRSSATVNAGAQSEAAGRIKDMLTPEELHVYKRGRNAHPQTIAKNARMSDYRRATGFEALFGYLYLEGRTERLLELAELSLGCIWKTEEKTDGQAVADKT